MNTTQEMIQDREISMTRLLSAPRELVWKVWTDPKHIAKWWGPNGFTNTIHKMDIRNGGEWNFIMHGPDGTNYRNEVIFDEIVEPERIAYTHQTAPKFQAIITFAERDDKTEMYWRMIFATKELRDKTIETFGAVEGLKQNIAKLEAYASSMLLQTA